MAPVMAAPKRPTLLLILLTSAGMFAGGLAGVFAGWSAVAEHGYWTDGMTRLAALHLVEPSGRGMLWGAGAGLIAGLLSLIPARGLRPPAPALVRAGWIAGSLAVIALLGLIAAHRVVKPPPPADRLHVVFILVDALRADGLGRLGDPDSGGGLRSLTPHLDALAERSLFFERAYSNAPKTVPSVASLFTSTHPWVHRVWAGPGQDASEGLSYLPDRFLLATEVFKNAGYRIGMATTTGWITPEVNYDQGVDEYAVTERADRAVVEAAEDFISRNAEEPFFLYVHLLDLHDYYHPDRLFAIPPEGTSPALQALRNARPSEIYSKLRVEPESFSQADARFLERAYERELVHTDALIERLVEALERAGIRERTRIVLTSDHGEQFLEHGRLVHGGNGLYEEVLRVPFLIAGAEEGVRRVVRQPIGSIDFMPTLLDHLGLPVPEIFEGESLARAGEDGAETGFENSVVATDGRTWKLVTARWSYIFSRKYDREELYDLQADPDEQRNLVTERSEVAHQLARELAERIRRSRRHRYLQEVEVERIEMTEDIEKTLRSLGYLE